MTNARFDRLNTIAWLYIQALDCKLEITLIVSFSSELELDYQFAKMPIN